MKIITCLSAMLCLWLLTNGALAEDQSAIHGEITPGFWLAGLSGDGTINGQQIKFNRTASDLLEHLHIGGSLAGKITWRQFALGGQLDAYSMSTRDLKLNGSPVAAKLDTDVVLSELAAGYTLDGRRPGQTFTVALGIRFAHISNELTLGSEERLTHSRDRWDPMLILWPTMPLLERHVKGLSLTPALSIGGGGDSELVYELFPQLRYQLSERLIARFGYRSIGYRTRNSDNKLDFDLTGFIASLGATF